MAIEKGNKLAQIIIELSEEAKAHAEAMATAYGFESSAEHIREWLTNTGAQFEKQKRQKEIVKLEAKINLDAATLYEKPT